jgi:phospholipase C
MTNIIRRVALFVLSLALASVAAHAQDTTKTPIKHVIVLFQENVSFDHYFATYPNALNLPGEVPFHALPGTPRINGLDENLLKRNPNSAQPMRLAPREATTCDMDHEYTAEQQAFDGGKMDKFVEYTSSHGADCDPALVMAYFDGNTVTALWHYAQHFALSDNFFGTTFGPSTPGAINLISGNTHGATLIPRVPLVVGPETGTVINDPDPAYDDCSDDKIPHLAMSGRNIGDLLNAKQVTWGWFEGGFKPSGAIKGRAVCDAVSAGANRIRDYSPHHEPFQYYAQTANPRHLPRSAPDRIGRDDQANHQYDLADFYEALDSGNLPAVSFVKAKAYQDGHAGPTYSNPVDEQAHLVGAINAVMRSRYWLDTAIVIAYDDSDGWYDHVAPTIVNGSALPGIDAYDGPGRCGKTEPGAYQGRCGYGPRLPLLIVSLFAKANFVDHGLTDQTSIIRFIEDNWALGRIGDQSYDATAGPLDAMFDFTAPPRAPLLLDEKGVPYDQ